MPLPTETFFAVFGDSFKKKFSQQLDKKECEKLTANNMVTLSGAFEAELNDIKAKLKEKGLRIGEYINNGNLAYIFQLETASGEVIPSAVVRLEMTDPDGKPPPQIDNPIMRRPVAQVQNNDYVASILPRAVKREDWPRPIDREDMYRTFAALRATGSSTSLKAKNPGEEFTDMDRMVDVSEGQIMFMQKPDGNLVSYLDGTPVGIITDMNSFWDRPGLQKVDAYCKRHNFNYDTMRSEPPLRDEEIAHIRAQMDDIYQHTQEKIAAALRREAAGKIILAR